MPGVQSDFLLRPCESRGVDARGIDVSEWAIAQVPEHVKPYCRVGSITEAIEGHYDLITCIEVLEHLPAFEADPVIRESLRTHGHCSLLLHSRTISTSRPT